MTQEERVIEYLKHNRSYLMYLTSPHYETKKKLLIEYKEVDKPKPRGVNQTMLIDDDLDDDGPEDQPQLRTQIPGELRYTPSSRNKGRSKELFIDDINDHFDQIIMFVIINDASRATALDYETIHNVLDDVNLKEYLNYD